MQIIVCYVKNDGKEMLMIIIWVDDIIISCSNDEMLKDFKQSLKEKFKMTDLGDIKWFLGMSFECNEDFIEINQSRYILKILERFGMSDCNPCKTPCDVSFSNISHFDSTQLTDAKKYREMVGSLIYVMIGTRPDLSYIVTKLSQYMSQPSEAHYNAAKRVLKYLKGTSDYSLKFSKADEPLVLLGFSDSDWGNSEDRKSITGYCFKLQNSGPLISWKSKKQSIVALSSCEAEYIALTHTVQEAKFLKQLICDILFLNVECYIGVDNQGAIMLSKNPVFHQRSKHIDIRYHFIRDEISKGNINIFYVQSNSNIADVFTKPVSLQKMKFFQANRGI